MRIYVGGLGLSVEEDDIKKIFGSPQLGTVSSVEIIRSKGRSFAYLEFDPVSEKGISKLFSKYNGCLWKGGRLKLEKAKEHYLIRLKREWDEDAELKLNMAKRGVDMNGSAQSIHKLKKDKDFENAQLNIFFPKLRKIKPVPLKGTGKHKYSFQRVEVPPLPINFCDCEEHSQPLELARKNRANDSEPSTILGVTEDEFNIMKSVVDQLLGKENDSIPVTNETELCKQINHEEIVSDEDSNLVINIVSESSKRVDPFDNWGQKTVVANQESKKSRA